jgi:proline dehydrogenase
LYMAQNESIRKFVMTSRTGRGISQRFVAGAGLDEAIEATRVLNQQGLHVTLDHLGGMSPMRRKRKLPRRAIERSSTALKAPALTRIFQSN